MLPVSGITPFGGAAIQLARVLAPFAGQALHALASRSVMHSASPSTAAAAIPQTVAHRPASEWFVVRSEERVEVPATPHEEEPIFEVHHSSQRFANTLSTYRSTYPESVWTKVLSLYPNRSKQRPIAIDIAVGSEGRAGVELARRGFRVIGVEADATLLARTFRFAQAHNTHIQLITAKVEHSMLQENVADLEAWPPPPSPDEPQQSPQQQPQQAQPAEAAGVGAGWEGERAAEARFNDGTAGTLALLRAVHEQETLPPCAADMVTFMHGLHLVDTPRALQEAHRLLKPSGALVAAWNDRDLSHEFVDELEELFERYNPHYCRYAKQRDLDSWGQRLEQGGMFKLKEYSVHANPMPMKNAVALLDILDCMSFVRTALRGADRKAFNNDVRALVERRYGRGSFQLPLETKLFVLEKVHDGPSTDPAQTPFKPHHMESMFKV